MAVVGERDRVALEEDASPRHQRLGNLLGKNARVLRRPTVNAEREGLAELVDSHLDARADGAFGALRGRGEHLSGWLFWLLREHHRPAVPDSHAHLLPAIGSGDSQDDAKTARGVIELKAKDEAMASLGHQFVAKGVVRGLSRIRRACMLHSTVGLLTRTCRLHLLNAKELR